MKKLIDKSAVVAKIEELDEFWHLSKSPSGQAFVESLLSFLDTLKTKEVDLEYEINKVKKMQRNFEIKNDTIVEFCAKHFFELGIKAQKGE